MTAVPESRIVATAVSKDFGYQRVLRDISLVVEQGEYVVLMGPNGVGKTTLLRMLAGLSVPTAGSVTIADVDLRRAGPGLRRRVGFVSHESLLYPDLTGRENLEFHARLFGVASFEESLATLSDILGLGAILDRPAGILSRGNRQRLTLARALLHAPSVLLLDEPFTGLDQQSADQLLAILQHLVDSGRTVVMTSHDPTIINAGPRRLIELDAGGIATDRVLSGDSPTRPQLPNTYLQPQLRTPPGRLGSALAVASKDLRVEARTKDLLGSAGLFALCVLITTSFTMPPGEEVSGMATGVLWVSILFAAILAVGRSMAREAADRGIEGLLLSPAPRESVFIGKALGAFVLMITINLISAALFLVVMASGATRIDAPQLAATALLGTTGLVLVTTLFSGIAVGSRLGESMLPLLVMPVAIPLMVGSVELTRMALGADSAGRLSWSGLLLVYDLMVGIVATATFGSVIEE